MSSVRIGGSGSDGESQRGAAVIKCWVGATETSCPGDRRGVCGNGVRPQRAPKSPLHSLAGGAGRGGGGGVEPDHRAVVILRGHRRTRRVRRTCSRRAAAPGVNSRFQHRVGNLKDEAGPQGPILRRVRAWSRRSSESAGVCRVRRTCNTCPSFLACRCRGPARSEGTEQTPAVPSWL